MAIMGKIQVAVLDGQGGGLGKALIEKIRQVLGDRVFVIALGTNSLATSAMLRAGADAAATGENAVLVNVAKVDFVMGAMGIVATDSMLGEISSSIACAVGKSDAEKILVPVNKCQISVAGVRDLSFGALVDDAVNLLKVALG